MCDVIDLEILTIDHINDDGAEDRRNRSLSYNDLRKSPLRSDLQVLCQNHNLGKRCLA
jgi:hypothetical protein